jgi:signal transduction histidine kinase
MRRAVGPGRGLGLRFRVFLLVGVGVVGPGVVLTVALGRRLAELDETLLASRQRAAAAAAGQLDEELTLDLETLQRAASAGRVDLEDTDDAPERVALHDLYLHNHFPESVFFMTERGRLVAEEPVRGGRSLAAPPGSAEVQQVLRSGRPAVTALIGEGGEARTYAMVPVRNWEGNVVGISGGVIEAGHERFTRLLRYLKRGHDSYADLVDRNGRILASTERSHLGRRSECAGVGVTALSHKPMAGKCVACHRGSGILDQNLYVLAAAPLGAAPWAVALKLPAEEVLASSGAFSVSFVILVLAMLLLAALFSWGAARSVTMPVAVLTGAAERIAAGNLADPIPNLGEDEVGRLGNSLERMRSALRQTNEELERRVADRTVELARVNERLRERERSLAELYGKVVGAQEEERRRLARELHDETSQSLAVLVMGIDSALAAVKNGLTPRLDEVKALAVRTIEEVHRMVLDLRPSVLDDLGLVSAVRWYAERHLQARGIAVRCEFGEVPSLRPEVETALFRICQEAMSNIARHAEADSVLVQVGVEAGALTVEIEDDGRGFDAGRAGASERRPFGLLGIRERVELIGGTVQIDSAPGKGTRVRVRLPLPVPEA